MKKKPAKGTARLAHTFRATTEQEPTLYVFNKGTGDGYMITPADDRFPALLGYGDNGDFNIDEISPAMKSFIEDYSREIDYAIKKSMLSQSNRICEKSHLSCLARTSEYVFHS